MTVANAGPLQQAVFQAIEGALEASGQSIKVYDHVPTRAGDEFIRLEGIEAADASFKNEERARHSVQVSFFSRARRGQLRVKEVLGTIHNALKDLRFGRGRMQFEYMDVDLGTDTQGDSGALRYTITL
ncbi:MAG: hypothetical protein AAFQ17_00025 [Pseudomonadota bacterium]